VVDVPTFYGLLLVAIAVLATFIGAIDGERAAWIFVKAVLLVVALHWFFWPIVLIPFGNPLFRGAPPWTGLVSIAVTVWLWRKGQLG